MQAIRTWGSIVLAISLLIAPLGAAGAQQTITSASLTGSIEDMTGARVNRASVITRDIATSQEQEAISDDDGEFRFPRLKPGTYEVSVLRSGFAPLKRRLTLTVGQALYTTFRLSVDDLSATVDVTAQPVVETVRTQLAETILEREVDSLPLNGRNYLDLAALTPGVTRTNPVGNQRFAETSAVAGTGLSIGGQRFINNGFVVDGLSSNDDAADLPGTFYTQEVVREFEVISSGGIAEFGRASGGFVNIITRSGTDSFHGRAYGFFRNQRFDARNPLAAERDPLTQAQYGGSLGGPIARHRTFFFSNIEQNRLHNATIVTISPANAATVNNRLDVLSFRGPRISTGITASGLDTTNFLIRLDHQFSKSNQMTARYSLYAIDAVNTRNVGGLNSVSRGTALQTLDQTIAISNLTSLSPKTINEVRFQYGRSHLGAPVNDVTGPAVNISGVANFGTATFSPTARDIDTYEAVETITSQRGSHSLKVGVNYLFNRLNIEFPGAIEGVYTFSSMSNFLLSRYTTFQQAFGETRQFQSNPNVGIFLQDEWRLTRRFTVNLGLRYDTQMLPDPITTDANNFAPRLGIAYAPNEKSVVRASFGIFFDRIPLRATSNALQRDGTKYRVATLAFGQPGAPIFPQRLQSFPGNLLVSITTIDPNIKNMYSQQASLHYERELFNATTFSIGYLHTRALHIILSRNLNVPTVPTSAGIPNLGRPDPRFANVSYFESSGRSDYHAFTVSLYRRFRELGSFRLSYTRAQSRDNAGNAFFFTPQDNLNLRDEWGLSDNDQRHRLAVSGMVEVPRLCTSGGFWRRLGGMELSYILSQNSGSPFNIVTGTDRNLDTNTNDRPVGVSRNSGKGFGFFSLDLRLSKRFSITEGIQIEPLAEAFNVLNHANFQNPNNVYGTGAQPLASFGQPTGAADQRQIQFGLRLIFGSNHGSLR